MSASAHESIRRTLAQYCQACDDGRFDDYAELFAEDARYEVPGMEAIVGRSAIREFIDGAQPPELRGRHMCFNSVIDVDRDSAGAAATASTDFMFVARDDAKAWSIAVVGRYDDRLVRDGDRWLFAERVIHFC